MTCVTSVTGVAPVATSTYEGAVTVSLVPAGIDAEYLVGMMSAVSSQAAVSGHIGWFNVKDDFGALGDGITDDTLAIQAAINSACTAFVPPTSTTARCGIVFFPPGSYLISQTLEVA